MPRRLVAVVLALASLLVSPALALGHPLGNFTVNRYSRLEVSGQRVLVRYVVDLAEIPTFQELSTLDANGDGTVDDAEKSAYAATRLAAIVVNLHLSVAGSPAPLRVTSSTLDLLPGQGGLQTMRLAAWLEAPVGATADDPVAARSDGRELDLGYRDDNEPDRIGWREIVIRAGNGARLVRSSVPTSDASDELRSYPNDMLTSPLDVRQAQATLTVGAGGADPPAMAGSRPAPRPSDLAPGLVGEILGQASSLTGIVAAGQLGAPAVALAFLLAALWGAAHALTPGHGKTIVAAYLVGSRGTARHAVYLGLTVTATHTLGIYALGLLTLVAARFVLPEALYPWLALLSGLAVVGVGLATLVSRARLLRDVRPPVLRDARPPVLAAGVAGQQHHHGYEDHHLHPHDHPHDHHHAHDPEHPHNHAKRWPEPSEIGQSDDPVDAPAPLRAAHGATVAEMPLAFAAGSQPFWLPTDGARGMSRDSRFDRSDEPQAHAEGDHHHDHHHHHYHYHHHSHQHGPGSDHSHLPPGAAGEPVTWRSLLALGVAGGILPCPSALVLLLGAIALGQVAFGLALVVAFSAGLALVLIGIGIAFVYARQLLDRPRRSLPTPVRRLARLAPLGSAALIAAIGLVMSVQALGQTGLLGRL